MIVIFMIAVICGWAFSTWIGVYFVNHGGYPWSEIDADDYDMLIKMKGRFKELDEKIDILDTPVKKWKYQKVINLDRKLMGRAIESKRNEAREERRRIFEKTVLKDEKN